MIVTVTLNFALDVTYRVAKLTPGATHRVAVAQRAGGKGVNAARVLTALGADALLCGCAGGRTGETALEEVSAAGLRVRMTSVAGESRRTVTVVDGDGAATGFWEPGPTVSHGEWDAFLGDFDEALRHARAVVLAGSLPPGVPADAYAVLCDRARRTGVPAVLDADGEALRLGLAGAPQVVKPNVEELQCISGSTDPWTGATALRELGASSVVASLGAEGLIALTEHGCWQARPVERQVGNPTGAGDACVAALALGLARGQPWPERIAEAVAVSAAAVRASLAGTFDPDTYRRQRAAVTVEAAPNPVRKES